MAPTATAGDHDNNRIRLERRISRQAADEGHDADIPSGEGYVLDATEERKRRASLAERRRKSDVEQHPRPHTAAGDPSPAPAGPAKADHSHHLPERDVEKGGGGAQEPDPESGSGSGTSPSTADDDDVNIVWWEDNDPEHPYNWPKWRTFVNCLLVSLMVFITPLASCKPLSAATENYRGH